MNNGLPGPSTTDTITGGKTLELSSYDNVRKPHKVITDGTRIKMTTRTLSTELCCPICLDLLTSTMTTKECLHRFCLDCITTALMRGNKECPTCRKKIVSKRSLRPDPNFDNLINKIWPDRRQYEKMQEAALKIFQEQSNVKALQKSIEAGMKAQAANRRMRVQGSYNYEKKKRRPTAKCDSASATISSLNNSNQLIATSSATNVSVDDDEVHDETSKPNINYHNQQRQKDNASSTVSDETETGETAASLESSELSESSKSASLSPTDDKSESLPSSISSVENLQKQPNHSKITNVKPPSSFCTLNDKMNKWLSENQNCALPLIEENMDDDTLATKTIDIKLEDMLRKGEEIEVEFIPAKSLCRRLSSNNFPPSLLTSRFLKASPATTMEHFAEYLRTLCGNFLLTQSSSKSEEPNVFNEGITSIENSNSSIKRLEYFYILDHNNQIRKIFLHETLYSAFIASVIHDRHLQIFFDIFPPDTNSCSKLITEIISDETLLKRTQTENVT